MKYICKVCQTEVESTITPSFCEVCGGVEFYVVKDHITEYSNEQKNDNYQKEWINWWGGSLDDKNGVGHKSAIKAMTGLRNFIHEYVRKRNDLIRNANEEKANLDSSFNNEKKSINDEYNKSLEMGQASYDNRINTNRQKSNENNQIRDALVGFVDGINNKYMQAKSFANVTGMDIAKTLDESQSELQRQYSLIGEFKAIDQKICELKAQSKLANSQLEYDISRKNIDDKYIKLTQDCRRESDIKIEKGMSNENIKRYSQTIEGSVFNETRYESPDVLPDYIKFGTLCLDIDDNLGFDYTDILHTVEKQVSGVLKKSENKSTVELPYCQRLMDGISLLVKYDDQDRRLLSDKIKFLLLKLFMYFPAGKLEATMIDPLEMGTSFQGIPKLAGITNERIIDTKIWSKEQDIENAIATLRLGEYEKAFDDLCTSIILSPKEHPLPMTNIGYLIEKGFADYDVSKLFYKALVKRGDINAEVALANQLFRVDGEVDDAMKIADNILKKSPNNLLMWFLKAMIDFEKKEFLTAYNMCNECIKLEDTYWPAYFLQLYIGYVCEKEEVVVNILEYKDMPEKIRERIEECFKKIHRVNIDGNYKYMYEYIRKNYNYLSKATVQRKNYIKLQNGMEEFAKEITPHSPVQS